MSSILEIDLADWANIWPRDSLTVSAPHMPGLGVTRQPMQQKTAKINCMGWVAYIFGFK